MNSRRSSPRCKRSPPAPRSSGPVSDAWNRVLLHDLVTESLGGEALAGGEDASASIAAERMRRRLVLEADIFECLHALLRVLRWLPLIVMAALSFWLLRMALFLNVAQDPILRASATVGSVAALFFSGKRFARRLATLLNRKRVR